MAILAASCPNLVALVSALSQDGSALLSVKASLDPSSSAQPLANWHAGDPTPCGWSGVTCNESGVVVSLDLSNMQLCGTISDDIQLLSPSLLSLNLSSNNFSGPLPLSLANLTGLRHLDISRNSFNSTFPARAFFRLKSLVAFSAYNNNFMGPLPVEFIHLPFLTHFDLGGSYFNGPIPPEYGAFPSLSYLDLSGNRLSGPIPPSLASDSAASLTWLKLGWNHYQGGIPPHLGNLTNLRFLDISGAFLTGPIPSTLAQLSYLETLYLYENSLSSAIPEVFGNLTRLQSLDLSVNQLAGTIPPSFRKLKQLQLLSLMYNQLSGGIPEGLAELPELQTLLMWNNSLSGVLPALLGSNAPLAWLDVSGNRLTGTIPPALCAGSKLFKLMLFSNSLSGQVPPSLARCPALWRIRIEDNLLAGPIPSGFGALPNLTYFDASRNQFVGGIPTDLAYARTLEFVDLSHNPLGGIVPPGIWHMRSLQKLYASSCNLTGSVPVVSHCPPLITLDLSNNGLSSAIPNSLALCEKLTQLDLSYNRLIGVIPSKIASLPVLAILDLSHNNLTGPIPSEFQNSTTLETLDVSYNNLSGSVPTQGIFKFIIPDMLAGNRGLCGGILLGQPCANIVNDEPSSWGAEARRKGIPHALAWFIIGVIFALTLVVLAVGSHCFYKRYKWYICSRWRWQWRWPWWGEGDRGHWKLTSFQRLNFTSDDIVQCLKSTNIIGMGAAGTVYKAEIGNGDIIAVKKLWRSQKEMENKSMGGDGDGQHIQGEVDVLGSVRHRNIVRLLGCCSNNETTLLLYEFMPNGSLGDLLHGKKTGNSVVGDWMTRYKIAMGVAQGLCYLHHDCFPVIIHRDVKSNNILLDTNMEARVADFGVAKLIETTESMSVIAGSYGYIAPEYAYTMQVDEKSDIYSFGVVLLEILTGKRPIEPEFGESANIVEWVREKSLTSEGLNEVLDVDIGASSLSWVREEMMLVLQVALMCTSKVPMDRPSMRDVVTMLTEAKPRRKTVKEPQPPSHPQSRLPPPLPCPLP